jgi:Fic family protein
MEILEKVEQLKAELDALRPLDGEAEARVMQKFRLDWNYHSNNIEGNSLTYGETKALILFGITAQGKPLKDHFEITGHNEAINWIMEVIKDKTPLTEVFIRELHTLLLKESTYKNAETSEGKPTRRKIEVGKYKTQPNHVITATGETFYFATPEETPAKMQELVEWFRKEKENPDLNPVILASLFHYRFIRIHPFDDGNGRVARILMNFILMQFGYPPVIIKTEDKENYYAVLRLADADQLEPFIGYIAENLVRSLEIMVKGAKGEDIEEPDDLDKELALLDTKLRKFGGKLIKRTREVVISTFDSSIEPLLNRLITDYQKFEKFYIQNIAFMGIAKATKNPPPQFENALTSAKSVDDLRQLLFSIHLENNPTIMVSYHYNGINRHRLKELNFKSHLNIKFNELDYEVIESNEKMVNSMFKKKYSQVLSSGEINEIARKSAKRHTDFIEKTIIDSDD